MDKAENAQSLIEGNCLKQAKKKFAYLQKTYANARDCTKKGFHFEEDVCVENNLREIRFGTNVIYLTDRDEEWPYSKNDTLSDLVVFKAERGVLPVKKYQLKCCESEKNCISAITATNTFGYSKYEAVGLVIPKDQKVCVEKSLSAKIEKFSKSNPRYETSIFDPENTELSGFYAFKPLDQTIRPLARAVTALEGVSDSAEILAPSYCDMTQIVSKGLNAKSIRREILKTDLCCIWNLTKKNLPLDLTFDVIYSASGKESTKDFVIRITKTVGASTAVAIAEHKLGKEAGIAFSKSDTLILHTAFRIIADFVETSVVAVKHPQDKNKILKKINSDFLEEAERFGCRIYLNKGKV